MKSEITYTVKSALRNSGHPLATVINGIFDSQDEANERVKKLSHLCHWEIVKTTTETISQSTNP